MSKLMNAGTKGTLRKAAMCMATCGFLLVGFLTLPANRAEAGITGQVTVVNNTDFPVEAYVDGMDIGEVPAHKSLKYSPVSDDVDNDTNLRASDGTTEWKRTVVGSVGRGTWELDPNGFDIFTEGK